MRLIVLFFCFLMIKYDNLVIDLKTIYFGHYFQIKCFKIPLFILMASPYHYLSNFTIFNLFITFLFHYIKYLNEVFFILTSFFHIQNYFHLLYLHLTYLSYLKMTFCLLIYKIKGHFIYLTK